VRKLEPGDPRYIGSTVSVLTHSDVESVCAMVRSGHLVVADLRQAEATVIQALGSATARDGATAEQAALGVVLLRPAKPKF